MSEDIRMKFMVKLETIIMNRTGCNRETANLVANDILNEVDEVDFTETAEVKHGYWFISEYEYLNCSECGESYFTGADSTAEAKERLAKGMSYPYCPHCGAKMDAEPPKKRKEKRNDV